MWKPTLRPDRPDISLQSYNERYIPGSGSSRNKMNRRVEIFENLRDSIKPPSATRNLLQQTITRNTADEANDARSSLNLLRQAVQHEISREITEVIDRHVRTTFQPAFENIRRNKSEVTQNHVNELCRDILETTKLHYCDVEFPVHVKYPSSHQYEVVQNNRQLRLVRKYSAPNQVSHHGVKLPTRKISHVIVIPKQQQPQQQKTHTSVSYQHTPAEWDVLSGGYPPPMLYTYSDHLSGGGFQ